MQNKIDFESVRFSLDNIVSTLGLVMEDIEQEHLDSKEGLEKKLFQSHGFCVYSSSKPNP